MGPVGRTLFGGGKSESQSQPRDVTPGAFRNFRQPTSQVIQALLGASGRDPLAGVPSLEGPQVAPLGGPEQEILGLLQSTALSSPFGPATSQLESTLSGEFLPGQEGANPFLQAAIEGATRPVFQGLEETLSRTLPGRFTEAGHFVQPDGSSAFDRAAAIATRGAAQEAGDIASRISAGAFEAERGRQEDAATRLGEIRAQELQSTIANLQAQALPRLIEEQGIERGVEEFNTRLNAILQVLALATGSAITIGQESKSRGTQARGVTQGVSDLGGFGIGALGGVS